jgi:hypothetical protein
MKGFGRVSNAAISVFGLALALSGCGVRVGVSAMTSVPKDAAATCAKYCSDIGMGLDAVVIMGAVGCVCRPAKAASEADHAGAAAAGGIAAMLLAEEAQKQQQQQK